MWQYLGCYCFLFEKQTVKRPFRGHILAQLPPGRRPNDKQPVKTSQRSDLCKNVLLQCYLVATVIHIQSVRSHICVYVHTFFTIHRRWSGKGKKKKKIGTAVNVVYQVNLSACQGNLAACHIGHVCHSFGRPSLVYIRNSTESDYRNCSYISGLL